MWVFVGGFGPIKWALPHFDWTVLSQSVCYISLVWLRVCQLQIEYYCSHLCFLTLFVRRSKHNYLQVNCFLFRLIHRRQSTHSTVSISRLVLDYSKHAHQGVELQIYYTISFLSMITFSTVNCSIVYF